MVGHVTLPRMVANFTGHKFKYKVGGEKDQTSLNLENGGSLTQETAIALHLARESNTLLGSSVFQAA
jgi:hypothetical protein